MDRNELIQRGKIFFKTYRYPVLIILLGICLMQFPAKQSEVVPQTASPTIAESKPTLEEQISEFLSQMEGAGRVRILLTTAAGEETVYQTDSQSAADEKSISERTDTVILNDNLHNQTGMVRQINPPSYLGAIVLCQGADRASVRLAIVEAVSNAVGLSYDKITVLKMK